MSAPTFDLGKLHGGLRLRGHKSVSTAQSIQTVPIPAQLVLPITQHVGDPAQPIVGIGERVLKGQLIAEIEGSLGAPVHASSSGRIVAIEPWPVSRRNGDTAPCIIIECDGEDKAISAAESTVPYEQLTPEVLLHKILQGGIVGLGGAVFPTAQKLMQARTCDLDFLILNGVECEPYISCDDMLMREHALEILGGAQILMHALQLSQCYVAVESDKPDAIHRLAEVMTELDDNRLILKQVPTIYPSGGEDQLVQLVTNREVPSAGLPSDVGCLVQNVGTASAIYDWIVSGEPLISRVTTITGDGIVAPVNVAARIGTTIADIVEFAGGYTDRAEQLIIGGPMTGRSVTNDRVPLVKATNSILVLSEAQQPGTELPCIRCGDCAAVCPVQLLPQQLFWYACADDEKNLRSHGLIDCIECGCCDLVCPSQIPLTADFRQAKGRIREMADEKSRAERARQRFEARNERLDHDQEERERELTRQKDVAKSAGPAAIAEILRRKQDAQDSSTAQPETLQQDQTDSKKTDPEKIDPAKIDPAKTDPAKKDRE
jgi:electron transport complex protein RnfC